MGCLVAVYNGGSRSERRGECVKLITLRKAHKNKRMSLYEICQALQDSAIGTSIRESIWTFPIIETVHVLGLAVSVGILVMLDLRLVGAGMRHIPASDIMHKLKRWYLAGFTAMFASGALLFWSGGRKMLSQSDLPHQAGCSWHWPD